MKPADTSREAHEVQLEIYRRMSPEQKLALAIRMSEEVREVAADGIRARHPFGLATEWARARQLAAGGETPD